MPEKLHYDLKGINGFPYAGKDVRITLADGSTVEGRIQGVNAQMVGDTPIDLLLTVDAGGSDLDQIQLGSIVKIAEF